MTLGLVVSQFELKAQLGIKYYSQWSSAYLRGSLWAEIASISSGVSLLEVHRGPQRIHRGPQRVAFAVLSV